MLYIFYNFRRMTFTSRILINSKEFCPNLTMFLRYKSDNAIVAIGDVSKQVKEPLRFEYVPRKYLLNTANEEGNSSTLKHLKWMLQKDVLSQDIFLMGGPGTRRRKLALAFLELTDREVEYIALSRDTTEADLKQRREIQSGTAYYHDQSAVKAAINGRVLIIEGVEKAERNVLPVLNNLLENREMHLEDGRFLIPAARYDKLLENHTPEELNVWRLVRVSEDFRVIALGMPSPRYPGHPLDPPLRSRFQARHVPSLSYEEQLDMLKQLATHTDPTKLTQLLSCAHAFVTREALSLGLPDFPLDNLSSVAFIMDKCPYLPVFDIFYRCYPYKLFLGRDGQNAVESILDTFNISERVTSEETISKPINIDRKIIENNSSEVSIKYGDGEAGWVVPCGTKTVNENIEAKYVETDYQNNLMASMLETHAVSDFCLIGSKGCGKSITVQTLANLLKYQVEPVVLYQDMTSRDLIQQRSTLSNGDTIWKNSPLVDAALEGKLAILDGINRIDPSTLGILHRLVHDREIQLYDGKRLIRADRYDEIKEKFNKSDAELEASGVLRIHPSFRIVALAEKPTLNTTSSQWLNSELLSLFLFHEMRPLTKSEELHIIRSKYGEPSTALLSILELTHVLRSSSDPTLQSLAGFLSTRQLLRIAGRMQKYQTEDAYSAVQRACLARFLPSIAKQALEDCCTRVGIVPMAKTMGMENLTCQIKGNVVKIGRTIVERYNTTALTKVPDVLFYDVPQHVVLLENLLQDFSLRENLLLVGNQGVGKNKIVDRLLQLLNRPREYIQLHRDTTVQTLTLQPMVRDGKVVYEDSPLVQAVKLGHVLVVDEADKAPTHVTCILKTLVESGEMILSDGRRIVSSKNFDPGNSNIIPLHPDFRIIVLANRPGFPFLGHDFFGALGDLFSTHAVDNPTVENEIQLLKQYGPHVDSNIILKLVNAFGELRNMADQGLVSYPYSTREVVNIVKHLQKYPQEPLGNVVRNVFDFDRYNEETFNTLVSVLHKHGIPIGTSPNNVALAKLISLPGNRINGTWNFSNKQEVLSVQEKYVKLKSPIRLKQRQLPLDRVEARSALFTELQSYWTVPIGNLGVVAGLTVIKGMKTDGIDDKINILAINPLKIFSMNQESDTIEETSLPSLINFERVSRPSFTMASDNDQNVIIHEETNNLLLLLNLNEGVLQKIELASFFDMATDKISNAFRNTYLDWKMKTELIKSHGQIVFYTYNSNKLEVIDLRSMSSYMINLPFEIQSILLPSEKKWMLQDMKKNKYVLKKSADSAPCPNILQEVQEINDDKFKVGSFIGGSNSNLNTNVLSAALQQKIDSPNRLLVTDNTYAIIAVGFPDLESPNELYSWPRPERNKTFTPIVTENGQIIRTVAFQDIPEDVLPNTEQSVGISGYLEVVDIINHKVRYIPIPEPVGVSHVTRLLYPHRYPLYVASKSNQDLVTVDAGGCVRLWETSLSNIERSLDEWRKMVGNDNEYLQITKERYSGLDVSSPKHGKIDAKNEPHVGGNTWAGGTGGRDTAGLGGKGGPYRLDAGHTVHQLSDEEKNAVPEHVKKAAREMGLKAFKQRLREINMNEYDHSIYSTYSNAVQQQVKALRIIIDSLQAKSKERQWYRHQTSGELDDTKLIEGLTGEKTIYRRRAEKEPEFGAPQTKPKRLKLVVDVSGSMYRFNGHDGRLDREMEACVMVMEAFSGYEGKFQYDIVGHSGDDYHIPFVNHTHPPKDNKGRLEVIQTMHAHSQFCLSGDNTLEATQHAITSLATEDTDESIVVVLSDANFDRYRIKPENFAKILTSNPKVNAYAIFIGSLGNQAFILSKRITGGRAFVCMDLKDIPRILQQIFAASLLSTTHSS